jgi:hypothetical protein
MLAAAGRTGGLMLVGWKTGLCERPLGYRRGPAERLVFDLD